MARGRGKLTPADYRYMEIISANINHLLESTNTKQIELSRGAGIAPSTLTGYVKGTSLPIAGNVQKMADFFGVKKSDIDPRLKTESSTTSLDELTSLYMKLHADRQRNVIRFTQRQWDEQNGLHETRSIYLVGQTAAGEPIEYNQIPADQITAEVPDGADYALMVNGDSMEPLIKNGSIIFYKAQPTVENGELAIVEIEGNSVTCKKFYFENGKVILKSINPQYEDMAFEEGVRVLGKVIL